MLEEGERERRRLQYPSTLSFGGEEGTQQEEREGALGERGGGERVEREIGDGITTEIELVDLFLVEEEEYSRERE